MLVQAAEQAVGAQRGKPGKQAAHVHVLAGLEARDGATHQTESCRHALVGTGASRPHALCRLRVGATALRLGRHLRRVFNRGLGRHLRPDDASVAQRLAQGRFIHTGLAGHRRNRAPRIEQPGALRGFFRRHDRCAANRLWQIERTGALLCQLPGPAHECPGGDVQTGSFHLAGPHMTVGDERRDDKALAGGVGIGMREIIIGADEICDQPLLFHNAEGRTDSNCAVRKALQH